MKGNLVLDRVRDEDIRRDWHAKLSRLSRAISKLNQIRMNPEMDPAGLEYLEAVMEFIEARDEERNFFFDCFVRPGTPDKELPEIDREETIRMIRSKL